MSSPSRNQPGSDLNTRGFLHVSQACERMNCELKHILKIMRDCNVPIPPLIGNLDEEQLFIRESWISVYEQNPEWAQIALSRFDILPKQQAFLPSQVKATTPQLKLLNRLSKEQLIHPGERTRLKILSQDAFLTRERARSIISHFIGTRMFDKQVNYTLRVGGVLDERADYQHYTDTISETPPSPPSV